MNFPRKKQQTDGGSPAHAPNEATLPLDMINAINASSNERKRLAHEAGMDNARHAQQGATKRPYSSTHSMAAAPSSAAEEKLGTPLQHGFPLRNVNLTNAAWLGHLSTDAQRMSNVDYPSSLFASSLANRHAELAQRHLLSRYLSPQMRLSSLATSLASSTAFGLGRLSGHHISSAAGVSVPGSDRSLAAFLSFPQADPLQSMAARLHQQQQGIPNVNAAFSSGDAFQTLPAVPVEGGSGHRSDRLLDMKRANLSVSPVSTPSGLSRPQGSMVAGKTNNNGSSVNAGDESVPIPLGIDEDPNWLSDFHVFVRKNLVELCWASSEDVALRNASNRVSSHQVGIRCRCCAHLNPSARAQRSSAFPSSIAQIYQSFTMMLRAHFSSCAEVPPALKEKFLSLKSKTTQGATDSKQYWIYSARKLGMVDSEDGIVMTQATTSAARSIPPFGSNVVTGRGGDESSALPLVVPNDRAIASDFLYTLLLQARRVRLQANEQRGNKKSLQLGLPGFACRHCSLLGRMGQCRIFPARRRTLPTKIYDLYEHLTRCTACPPETKELLEVLHDRENYQSKNPGHKELLDLIWSRLMEQRQDLPLQQQSPN